MNIILLIGAVLGLSSVMIAAYVDHALALYLTGKSLNSVMTAIKYHQFYALMISMIGLAFSCQTNTRLKSWLMRTAYLFALGTILFSFSIYISLFLNIPKVVYLTPIGGVILMTSWLSLIRTALLRIK